MKILGNRTHLIEKLITKAVLLGLFLACILLSVHLPAAMASTENIAKGKPVEASSYVAPYSPERAVDNDLNYTSRWYASGEETYWIKVDLRYSSIITGWELTNLMTDDLMNNGLIVSPADFKLEASTDGVNWSEIDRMNGNTKANHTKTVPATRARYVKLTITKGNNVNHLWTSIKELKIFGTQEIDLPKIDVGKGKILNTSQKFQYSLDSSNGLDGEWIDAKEGETTGIVFKPGKVFIREKANPQSHKLLIDIPEPSNPPNVILEEGGGEDEYVLKNATEQMEYSLDQGKSWSKVTAELAAGAEKIKLYSDTDGVMVRVAATEKTLASKTNQLFPAGKATISSNLPLVENTLDQSEITVQLSGDSFKSQELSSDDFELIDGPAGLIVESIRKMDNRTVTLLLSFNGTDFSQDHQLKVKVLETATISGQELLSVNSLIVTAFQTSSSVTLSQDEEIWEGEEDGKSIIVSVEGNLFMDTLNAANWKVLNLPLGVSVDQIIRVGPHSANIVLKGQSIQDYPGDIQNVSVSIAGEEFIHPIVGDKLIASSGFLLRSIIDYSKQIEKIEFDQTSYKLLKDQTVQLHVFAVEQSGDRRDITRFVKFFVQPIDGGNILVDSEGLLKGITAGKAKMVASFGLQSAIIDVEITELIPDPDPKPDPGPKPGPNPNPTPEDKYINIVSPTDGNERVSTEINGNKLLLNKKDIPALRNKKIVIENSIANGDMLIIRYALAEKTANEMDAPVIIELKEQVKKVVVLYDDQPYEYFQPSFNVSQDRQWMIEMNIPIDPKSVNNDSLSIINSKGEAIQLTFKVSDNNKVITLIPGELFRSGEIYILTLSQELKTPASKPLKVPVRMVFTVQ
ncbi:discoidin domain-containing protein [Cytobacillus solani]|uniref:F5/8 type C domain-containing protein n=1 Tax=Cytobacillus solani TaxID=1637975 RepID=A0A0Q3VJ81_9BACI|nr:discoidin domain-containing protein [Cytobacillus solani]KQL21419.1 hypothetical protein AN957_24605 [Cytobacillus solani]USK54717.1 discoidin domain-containing protein [Cytobacillus solani]